MSDSLLPHGLFVTHQTPPSMGFPKQEYWSGLPFPLPEDLPDPGIELKSPALQEDPLPLSHQRSPPPEVHLVIDPMYREITAGV